LPGSAGLKAGIYRIRLPGSAGLKAGIYRIRLRDRPA
jgi:hypothetical protein